MSDDSTRPARDLDVSRLSSEERRSLIDWAPPDVLATLCGFSPEEIAAIQARRARLRQAPEPPPIERLRRARARRAEEGGGFKRAEVDASDPLAVSLASEKASLEAEANRLRLPKQEREPIAYPPHVRIRAGRTRRFCTPLHKRPWWIRDGLRLSEVRDWLDAGFSRPHPVERAIVACLRYTAGCLDRPVSDESVRRIAPQAQLAFLIWFLGVRPRVSGYSVVLDSTPRGELAELMAHRRRPVRVETVSRDLGLLERLLGGRYGLLRYWQPQPAEAERRDLPRGTGRNPKTGAIETQAVNLYWIVDESFFSTQFGARFWIDLGDPGSRYLPSDKKQQLELNLSEALGVGASADAIRRPYRPPPHVAIVGPSHDSSSNTPPPGRRAVEGEGRVAGVRTAPLDAARDAMAGPVAGDRPCPRGDGAPTAEPPLEAKRERRS